MSDQSQFMLIQQGIAIYDFVHVHGLLQSAKRNGAKRNEMKRNGTKRNENL